MVGRCILEIPTKAKARLPTPFIKTGQDLREVKTRKTNSDRLFLEFIIIIIIITSLLFYFLMTIFFYTKNV